MSKKMQLPDEILDAVSGGVYLYQGELVTKLYLSEDRLSVTTKKGTVEVEWNDYYKKHIDEGRFEPIYEAMKGRTFDMERVFKLEDMVK